MPIPFNSERRKFLSTAGLAAAGAIVSACVPEGMLPTESGPLPTPITRDVESTKTAPPATIPEVTVRPTETMEPNVTPEPTKIPGIEVNVNSVDLVGIVDGFGGPGVIDYEITVESIGEKIENMYGTEGSGKSVEAFLGNQETPWLGALTDRNMTVVPRNIDGLELVVEESSRDLAVYKDLEGKRYKLETGYELDEKPLVMFWFREKNEMTGEIGGLKLGYILENGNMGLGQTEREMVEIGLIEVPSGVDSAIWTKAVVAGGSQGAEWSNQFNTVVWKDEEGNIRNAWDAEFDYVGVMVGEPGREVVVRNALSQKLLDFDFGNNIYDEKQQFRGMGIFIGDINEVAPEYAGYERRLVQMVGKIVGFGTIDLGPYFSSNSEFRDERHHTNEELRIWKTVTIRTSLENNDVDISILLNPDGIDRDMNIFANGNIELKSVTEYFNPEIGDMVGYSFNTLSGLGPISFDEWCVKTVMLDPNVNHNEAIGGIKMMAASIQAMGISIENSISGRCDSNVLIDPDGVDNLIADHGPVFPGGILYLPKYYR